MSIGEYHRVCMYHSTNVRNLQIIVIMRRPNIISQLVLVLMTFPSLTLLRRSTCIYTHSQGLTLAVHALCRTTNLICNVKNLKYHHQKGETPFL